MATGLASDGRRARQLARNALSGSGRYGVAAIAALAVTPYALGVLGDRRFGLWALAGALLGMLRLLDLGLNRSLMRAVAEAEGRVERTAARSALATGRGLALVLALVKILAVWWLRRPLIVGLFRVPPSLWPEAAYVLVGTAVVAAVETAFAPYQAALDGVGRMDLTNSVDTVQRVVSALGVVTVLSLGWGLEGLVWKNVATALLAGLAYRLLMRRRAPALASAAIQLDRAETRALLAFGRHVQLVNLGALLIEPVSKALLSRRIGLDAVTIFDLAWRVTSQLSGAFLALATALFPAAAERRAAAGPAGDRAVVALYRPAARFLAWLALPAYALLLALALPFVAAWLGPGYEPVGRAITILALGWLLAILSMPAFIVTQAGGRAASSTAASLVTVGVALGAAAVLVGVAGLEGVVAGVALGLAAGGAAILIQFARGFGVGRSVIASIGWRAVVAAGVAALGARAALGALGGSLGAVVAAGGCGCLVYAALMLALGAFGPAERAVLARLAGRGEDPVGD